MSPLGRIVVEPFVGREAELAALRVYADEVTTSGVGRMVVLTGEAGAGKTRLSSEFSRVLAEDGIRSVWSRCWGDGGGPPLWPWPDLVGELARQRGMEVAPAAPAEVVDRFQLFRTVAEQLRGVAEGEPGVALIDDLHAAAGDAVLLTKFVARSVHRIPLLLVATWRLDAVSGASVDDSLDVLAPEEATVVDIAPFDESELATYVHMCRGRPASPSELAALSAATGGNPRYVAEVVREPSLSSGGTRRTALRRLLDRRVTALSSYERRVLCAAAVLGDGATLTEVAAAVGDPAADVHTVINQRAPDARLVDHQVVFPHGVLRDALVASMSPTRRQRLHAAAASAICGSDVRQAVRRARHRIEAAPLSASDHAAAIDACREAATALQCSWEFEQAADWAAQGSKLAAGTSPPMVRARLILTHARAVLACGRLAEARRLYEAAIEPAEEAGDHRLFALAALGVGGVWIEEQRDEISRRRMLGRCDRALAALGPDDPVLSGLLRVRLAAEHAYDGGPADSVRAAVDDVRRLGDHVAIAEALSLYHHTLLTPAHAAVRLDVADELLDAAARSEGSIFSLFGLCWRTVDLYLAGDPRAERSFVELREQTTALASRSIGYIASVLDVMRTLRRGELDHAEHLAADVLALGQDVGDADAFGYYGGHLLGIRWIQGRLSEMGPMIDAVIDSATLRRRDRIYPAVRAYALAVEGHHGAAGAIIEHLITEGLESINEFSTGLATLAVLIETASVLADDVLADQLAQLIAPYAHLPVMPSLAVVCLGPGKRFLGVAHATAGRRDEAIGSFRDALIANRRLGNRPLEALIHADLATALRRRGHAGDDVEAAEHYSEAIGLGTVMGLTARVSRWEADAAGLDAAQAPMTAVPGALVRLDDTWQVEINGRTAAVDHVVGMRYIAALVARPDTDIPAAELSAAVNDGLEIRSSVHEAPALDATARRDYQRRLAELDRELDLADDLGDADRGRRAADERAALLDQLRRDTGLGGRARRLSDDSERCRMRVSKAIQRAIGRIEQADAVLGRALATRIRTGYVCRYESDPGQPIDWTIRVAA